MKASVAKDFSGGSEPDWGGESPDERDSAAGDVLRDGFAGARALPWLPGNSWPQGKARKHQDGLYWGGIVVVVWFFNVDPKRFKRTPVFCIWVKDFYLC